MPMSSYARTTDSERSSTSASLPGIQPWMCCTVVMPDAIISKAGVECVEVEIEVAGHQARREPQFERHVGGAELNRRQADVVVAIDEAGQQRLLTRADDRRIWIGGGSTHRMGRSRL